MGGVELPNTSAAATDPPTMTTTPATSLVRRTRARAPRRRRVRPQWRGDRGASDVRRPDAPRGGIGRGRHGGLASSGVEFGRSARCFDVARPQGSAPLGLAPRTRPHSARAPGRSRPRPWRRWPGRHPVLGVGRDAGRAWGSAPGAGATAPGSWPRCRVGPTSSAATPADGRRRAPESRAHSGDAGPSGARRPRGARSPRPRWPRRGRSHRAPRPSSSTPIQSNEAVPGYPGGAATAGCRQVVPGDAWARPLAPEVPPVPGPTVTQPTGPSGSRTRWRGRPRPQPQPGAARRVSTGAWPGRRSRRAGVAGGRAGPERR